MASKGEGKKDNVELEDNGVQNDETEGSESSFETALKQVSEHFALKRRNECENVSETGEGENARNECVEGFNDSSEEESYSADSDSSDTEESVETEFEGADCDRNESDDEDVGVDHYVDIPNEIRGGGSSGSGSDQFFTLGMSFGTKRS